VLALLLEAVQDEHSLLELHRVDGTIRATRIVFDNLKHSGTPEILKHLRCIVLIAGLSKG